MKNTEYIKKIAIRGKDYHFYDINRLEEKGIAPVAQLPYTIKILVENLLRKLDGRTVKEADLLNIAQWQKRYETPREIPTTPPGF